VWNFGLELPLSTVGDCDLGARMVASFYAIRGTMVLPIHNGLEMFQGIRDDKDICLSAVKFGEKNRKLAITWEI
jgi:hypothetical protein